MRHATTFRRLAVGIGLVLSLGDHAGAFSIVQTTFQVSHRDDDYKESQSGASTRLASTQDLWVESDQKHAFRFTNVSIPSGATIIQARLQVYSPSTGVGNALSGTARGQDVGDAPAWTGANFEITNAAKTATVMNVANLPTWTADAHNDVADVTAIVQEIVDRGDWASGNALTLYLIATSTASHRRTLTYDSQASRAAKLIVRYGEFGACNDRPLEIHPNDSILTAIDLGHSGIGHDSAAFAVDATLTFELSDCEEDEPPCGTCALSGPIANVNADVGSIHNRRCTGNTRTKCASNADCTGAGTCAFYVGSYLPSPGLLFCVGTRVASTLAGSADLDAGDMALSGALESTFFAASSLDLQCPRCLGDGAANDGVRGGTCSDGANSGQSCDVNGQGNPHLGPTSLDCPPSTALATRTNELDADTGSHTVTLTNASPNCTEFGFTSFKCLCSTCNDATAEPCATNADCPESPPGTAGICGGTRCLGGANVGTPCVANSECPSSSCEVPGKATRPNACSNGVCVTGTGTDEGQCQIAPTDSMCSTATHEVCLSCSDFRVCSNDARKVCVTSADCPGGTCVQDTCASKRRECFLDNGAVNGSVTATGSKTTPIGGEWNVTLANPPTCFPHTGVSYIDEGAGLPGLSRFKLSGHVNTFQ